MPFRFVHTADLHLDSPLRSLALRDRALADAVGAASRRAFERIADLCIDEAADALLIAGDLFDGAVRSARSAVFAAAQMRRLEAEGIRVFLIKGNHDAESDVWPRAAWPANVHVFSGHGGVVDWPEKGVAIHGVGFSGRRAPESLLPKYRAPVPDRFNIGLMHTSLAGAEGHDVYAPCSTADLAAHGFDYWALGHVHKRRIHGSDPWIVMPGTPQGRDIGEAGVKSATLVSWDGSAATVEARPTAAAVFRRIEADLSDLADPADLPGRLRAALSAARDEADPDDAQAPSAPGPAGGAELIARLELTAPPELAWRLRRDADMALAEARAAAADLGGVWVEKLRVTQAPGAASAAGTGGALDELARLMADDVPDDPEFRAAALKAARDLAAQLPPELRAALGESDAERAAVLDRLIAEGRDEALARLRGAEAP